MDAPVSKGPPSRYRVLEFGLSDDELRALEADRVIGARKKPDAVPGTPPAAV